MAAIVGTDLLWKYSVTTGSAGNSAASSAANSLGKYVSTTQWTGGTINDLFPDLSGAANAAGQVEYLCVFLHNGNSANTYANPVIYISAEAAGGASIAIAVDSTAASALGSATAQALTAASSTAPGSSVTSLAYSSPTTPGTGLSLGNIPSGQVKAIWVRRTATNSTALSNDGVSLTAQGDTGSL